MNLEATYAVIGISGTIFGAFVGGIGAWRGWWESPRRREERAQNIAVHDAILGEAEVKDRAGSVIHDKQPGLVALQRENADRLVKVEEAVVEFRHAIGIYTEVLGRLSVVEKDVSELKNSTLKDILTAAERAAERVAIAEMLKLADRKDAIDEEPEQ